MQTRRAEAVNHIHTVAWSCAARRASFAACLSAFFAAFLDKVGCSFVGEMAPSLVAAGVVVSSVAILNDGCTKLLDCSQQKKKTD